MNDIKRGNLKLMIQYIQRDDIITLYVIFTIILYFIEFEILLKN